MVFHCQPDDVVGRWSEYTHFTKLQSMFMKAQDTDTDQGQLAENYSDEKSKLVITKNHDVQTIPN